MYLDNIHEKHISHKIGWIQKKNLQIKKFSVQTKQVNVKQANQNFKKITLVHIIMQMYTQDTLRTPCYAHVTVVVTILIDTRYLI